ncbi:MAG: 4Fe-4S dicluster domain-containing protein, partial [Thermoanaerobaculia bacterium]|nr:4Fe-4S dicluster domain-containing protein [Thermoanaerobaculia bacterium]
ALHPRRSAVVPGPYADAAVHALAHAINAALGNTGATVHHHRPVTGGGSQAEGLTELTEAMRGGEVDLLLILGGNPVYDAPADLDFAAAMGEVPDRIHLGLYEDETAALCHWHVPAAHYLESWADDRAADGTVTLTQPLIEPLYDGHTAAELLSFLLPDRGPRGSYELIRDTWRERLGEEGFEAAWRRALHDGFLAGTAAEPVAPAVRAGAVADAVAAMRRPPGGGLELALRPDPTVWDGAFANNGWLQECPKPLTKLTWDNAALMAPATARALGLESEQVVRLEVDSRSVTAPVQVLPGHAPGAVSLHLGGGRERVGRVGRGVGVDAYALRTTAGLWWAAGLAVTPTRARHRLATTQLHHNIALEGPESEERHLIRSADLAHFREHPDFAQHMGHVPPPELSLFPPRDYEGHRWALTVDLNMCTGCNACVIACQAENNIPVVGKEEVLKGREMHWIRVDRYYAGDLDAPDVHHQPVMCQHCEQAPCEVVCPVAATVHSDEGLNDMVYNRCIGTRYCSNNCPYKVRRFNFFLYQDFETPVLELLRNPDVSVRSRGVMEKCTYCVQRINGARFAAEREGRKLRDGDIQTACQQACPARAITFGDMNDPDSALAARKSSPRNYGILEETNTRPRTTYLAKVSNPNPRLAADGADGGGHGDGEVG